MNKRNAAGISPEELSMQDAYIEGQRAGANFRGREANGWEPGTPQYHEFERGRMDAIGARLGQQQRRSA